MKKVLIIHGLGGEPNGGWRPWLMGQLAEKDIWACALAMPTPDKPVCGEWIEEMARVVDRSPEDEIYLVGHSLGVIAILQFLQQTKAVSIKGAVLVSGRIKPSTGETIGSFYVDPVDLASLQNRYKNFIVIHGDNDPTVPYENAKVLSEGLECELITIENGKHLNGSAGFKTLPQCLNALEKILNYV